MTPFYSLSYETTMVKVFFMKMKWKSQKNKKSYCFNNWAYFYKKKCVNAWFEISSVSLVKKRVCRNIPQSWPNHFSDLAKGLKNASLASKHFFLVPFFLPQKLWKNLKSDIWNFFLSTIIKTKYYSFVCMSTFFCFLAFEKAWLESTFSFPRPSSNFYPWSNTKLLKIWRLKEHLIFYITFSYSQCFAATIYHFWMN